MKYLVIVNEIRSLLKAYEATGNDKCLQAIILTHAVDAIEELQKSNVSEVKNGKWERDTDGLPRCSNCDEIALQRIMLHFPANQYFSQFVHSNFCPHCGCDMRQAKDGE